MCISWSIIVNSFGLTLDIFGVWLVFRHGLPPPDVEPDAIVTEETPLEEIAAASKRHRRCAAAGIGLITLGFALQIVSNFLPAT